MKNGYKVADMDTHSNTSYEILEKYVDPSFRPRLEEVAPYLRPLRGGGTTPAVKLLAFDRKMGEVPDPNYKLVPEGVRGSASDISKRVQESRGVSQGGHHRVEPQPGTQSENSVGRLHDMDLEGRDLDLLYPGGWVEAIIGMPDVTLAEGLWRAHHNYMRTYCSADPDRLKGMLVLPGSDIEWTITEMEAAAKEKWLSAVWLVLPEEMPYDHPDLERVWATMSDLDLPLVMHGYYSYPPYWPGYRDMWGNAAVARTAAPPWAAARYPNFRAGVAEVGHGWLPHWLIRLGEQITYVAGVFPSLKYKPIEYAQMGRIMCPAEPFEGPEMTRLVLELLGDRCITHQSDYPHPESYFPDTVEMVMSWPIWDKLGENALRRYFWDNGSEFLRMS